MTIHDTLFKLATLGDCSVITPELRAAVKDAYGVMQEVRNLMELGGSEHVGRIVECVRHCIGSAPGEAFAPGNIARSELNLQVEHGRIISALEYADSQEAAEPLAIQSRIIGATLSAIAKEYGPHYFDKPAQVEG